MSNETETPNKQQNDLGSTYIKVLQILKKNQPAEGSESSEVYNAAVVAVDLLESVALFGAAMASANSAFCRAINADGTVPKAKEIIGLNQYLETSYSLESGFCTGIETAARKQMLIAAGINPEDPGATRKFFEHQNALTLTPASELRQ
jgi:hypothetical protein